MNAFFLFIVATGAWLLLAALFAARQSRLVCRLQELMDAEATNSDLGFADFANRTLPKLGAIVVPKDEVNQSQLRARLTQAGFYQPLALPLFLAIKLLLTFGPLVVAGVMYLAGPTEQKLVNIGPVRVPMFQTFLLLGGAFCSILGNVGPSLWLDSRIRSRQMALRRALPDAMDLLVVCLEAGMSLPAAIQRVSDVLGNVHPVLGFELKIVDRSMQLNMPPGEALMQFGKRCNLEEIRRLASVITEAERLGGGMGKTLRAHAESLREQRSQRAEEMAHKAAVKVLFPTVALIFPAMFIVILGPAGIQIARTLVNP